jgi:NDP-sugar pyrophosphorylase family protein
MSDTSYQSKLGGSLEGVPAILLVGGMGKRLQSVVPSIPKPLARVGNLPFLELVVLQLSVQGIRRLVMSTGHLAEQIEQHFGDGQKLDVTILYSRESKPLGTAGAVRFAERFIDDATEFIVMNGDSFLELNIPEMIGFHRENLGLASMAVRRVPNSARFGTVEVDASQRIVGFKEKTGAEVPGVINGGVYVFDRSIMDLIPNRPSSLEKDVFPRVLDRGVYALEQHGLFIDIGTPEDYARAQGLSERLHQAIGSETQVTSENPPGRWPVPDKRPKSTRDG